MQYKNQLYSLIHTICKKRIFLLSIWVLAALCFAAGSDNSFIKARAFWIGEDPAATPDVHWTNYQGLLTQGYGSQPLWIKLQVKPLPNEPANLPIELNIRPGYRGCPKFCVNGQLAGNCHIDRRHHEQQETRCT